MNLTDVIRRPLITEKTSILREDGRTIVFHVAAGANEDRHQARGGAPARRQGRLGADLYRAWQGQAAGPFCRAAVGLEKAYVRLRDGEKLPEFLEGA